MSRSGSVHPSLCGTHDSRLGIFIGNIQREENTSAGAFLKIITSEVSYTCNKRCAADQPLILQCADLETETENIICASIKARGKSSSCQ